MKQRLSLALTLGSALLGLITLTTFYFFQHDIITAAVILFSFTILSIIIFRTQRANELNNRGNEEKLETEKIRFNQMTVFVDSISSGDYNKELKLNLEQDALARALVKMKDKLQVNAEEDLKRNWVNTGLAKFGEILRSDSNLETLADRIISNLVKYVNANQGGLFVLEEEGQQQFLELKAMYAYDRKKFVKKKILSGQGLTGQCWLEGEKIYMTDIPESYIQITSGLGEALPRCVLLVPLKVNDVCYGVIEIASFKDLKNFEIDFVEKLAESIASTISTAKVNSTTKALLESTQQQAEELRAQEEEMRQNMEELQATQEEMQRISSEMTEQLKVINSTIATIEFDLNGTIKDANENFLTLMGYTKEEVVDRHHKLFVTAEESTSSAYNDFWKNLAAGKSYDGEFKRIAKGGRTVWIRGMYSPMLNAFGQPVKVVKFAYDITREKQQQAEMQQSMEEITATQEEMDRISGEMSEQLRVINSTIATIEFDLNGAIKEANHNFLSLMGYDQKEIVGEHHKIFVTAEERSSADYRDFWRRLSTGKSFNGEFKRIRKDGKPVWIKGMYSPILNKSNEPVKVVKFAYDITREKEQQVLLEHQIEELRMLKNQKN